MVFEIGELALAYELRQEGYSWKRIAQGLGCDPSTLQASIWQAERNGIKRNLSGSRGRGTTPSFDLRVLGAAAIMRADGLGWSSIAQHLFADREKLRLAVHYARRKKLIA